MALRGKKKQKILMVGGCRLQVAGGRLKFDTEGGRARYGAKIKLIENPCPVNSKIFFSLQTPRTTSPASSYSFDFSFLLSTMANNKAPYKTTFEPEHTIQPIYTGGSVALDHGGRILATTLGEDALLTDLDTGKQLAKIDGVCISWRE
jgi:hypothetical protein